MTAPGPTSANRLPGRIEAVDVARGVALVAMTIYHFAWDLEFFGYAEPGMTAVGGWRLFARSIASSFLFLVGVSLVLAHADGVRWRGFWKRLALVGGAALLISAATLVAMLRAGMDSFIFFGILHQIAFASVAGLLFLRLPVVVIVASALAVIAAPHVLRSAAFDHPAFWWLGLSSVNPRSNDYVPVFPWFAAVLFGMAAARIGLASGFLARLTAWHPGRWSKPLVFIGRHSLAYYLLHQPVLLALLFVVAQIAPAPPPDRAAAFRPACEAQCVAERDADFCARYCGCMLDALQSGGRLDELYSQPASPGTPPWLDEMAWQCTMRTEGLEEPRTEEPAQ